MLRERDKIRAALLQAIDKDVKPRLNAIAAAGRALKRGGSADRALAATVAGEAAKLDRYIDNLVDLEPGSDQEPIELGALSIDLHRRSVRKAGDEVGLTPQGIRAAGRTR